MSLPSKSRLLRNWTKVRRIFTTVCARPFRFASADHRLHSSWNIPHPGIASQDTPQRPGKTCFGDMVDVLISDAVSFPYVQRRNI